MSNPGSTYITRAGGSFGSRNGQRWSRELAKSSDRARPSELAAGIFGSVDRIEPQIVRRAVEAQRCPWCGAGPYKVLAGHTNKAHGVDRAELRRLAGLPQKSSICDPEYSEDRRGAVASRPDWDETTKKANAASGRVHAYKSASDSRVKRLREQTAERDSQIVRAALAGTFRSEVAAQFGVSSKTVTAVLRRAGVEDDGRAQAAKLRGWGDEKKELMRKGFALAKGAEKAARVSRFSELGGSRDALRVMADEEGRTCRQMADILRRAGANVPDGRKVR